MVSSLRPIRVLVLCCGFALVAGCSRSGPGAATEAGTLVSAPTSTTVATLAPSPVASTVATTTAVPPTVSTVTATQPTSTTAGSTVPTTGDGANVGNAAPAPTTTTAPATAPGSAAATETDQPTIQVQGIDVPALGSGTTPYAVPTAQNADFGDAHNYPATDIFVAGGCGGDVTAPANGTIVEVRREDNYDKSVDNPATRGGKSVTMVGDDGVRYYLSHFDSIGANIEPGVRVEVGTQLGIVGTTGRSGACHIHFGISPICKNKEWSIRRGAIGPMPYLESWRDGGQASPVEAVQQYLAENPDACAVAEADPNAGDG